MEEPSLAELARVIKAGACIEASFQRGKSEAGKDEYQVRTWVGIELRRAQLASTFPQAPLRSRTVGFPEYGSDPGFPLTAFLNMRKLKRWLTYTHSSSVCPQARPRRQVPPTHAVDPPGTAKCPEPLCLKPVLLASGWCLPPPPRRVLPLRHRSYGLMRQTTPLHQHFVLPHL